MKLRGVNLLAAVFGELQDLVPEGSISTEELLSAAQKLIELSRNEYIAKPDREPSLSSTYFSHEVTLAFEKFQLQILQNENRIQSDHDLGPEGRQRLRRIMMGERRDMYLEVYDA
jgi:hypothetical protein